MFNRRQFQTRFGGHEMVTPTNQPPASMTVLAGEGRFAVINAYTNARGERVATLALCTTAAPPSVIPLTAEIVKFGMIDIRETISVTDAIRQAIDWCNGQSPNAGGL